MADEAGGPQNGMERIDPRFIVNLKGKEYPVYHGVLDLAFRMGLVSIHVELIQADGPDAANAIVKAVATFQRDGVASAFESLGEAGPESTKLRGCYVRLAETRAKGRALRDATNVGQTLLEELPDVEVPAPTRATTEHVQPARQPAAAQPNDAAEEQRRTRWIERWATLCVGADTLGIRTKPLPGDATTAMIEQWCDMLHKRILETENQAAAA